VARTFRTFCRNGLGASLVSALDPWDQSNCINGRSIGIHSLHKTAINDAIRNGAQMHEVREFAGHSDTQHWRGL